jgi:hypothetical protein
VIAPTLLRVLTSLSFCVQPDCQRSGQPRTDFRRSPPDRRPRNLLRLPGARYERARRAPQNFIDCRPEFRSLCFLAFSMKVPDRAPNRKCAETFFFARPTPFATSQKTETWTPRRVFPPGRFSSPTRTVSYCSDGGGIKQGSPNFRFPAASTSFDAGGLKRVSNTAALFGHPRPPVD